MRWVLGFVLFLLTGSVHAKTLSFSDTIPPMVVDWEDILILSKFPPGLGALTGIDVNIKASIDGKIQVENLENQSTTISSLTNVDIMVTRSDGSIIAASVADVATEDQFGAYDGVQDFHGSSGREYPLSVAKEEKSTLTNLSKEDLALFTGTDFVELPVVAFGETVFTGIGHLMAEAKISAAASIDVTYTYTEPNVSLQIIPAGAFAIGKQTTYTILVRNVGIDETVDTITVTDVLPAGFTFVSASGAKWTCTHASQVVTCMHSDVLAPNVSLAPLVIVVQTNSTVASSVSKTASVNTRGDVYMANNSATIGLFIAGGSKNEEIPSSPSVPRSQPTVSHSQAFDSEELSPTEEVFRFSEEHGAFGGPTKPGSGSVTLYDAQGCPLSEEYQRPHPLPESCLIFVPDRPLRFGDSTGHPYESFIEVLKKIQLKEGSMDFLLSGYGDGNVGPDDPLTREALTKLALLSTCRPFTGDIMEAGKRAGVIQGDPDGSLRGMNHVNNAEALAILIRSANALPKGYVLYSPRTWYEPYVHFAQTHRLVSPNFDPAGIMTRGELTKLVLDIMALNPDPRIYGFIAQIDFRHQQWQSFQNFYTPMTLVGRFEPQEGSTCDTRVPHILSCLAYDPWREVTFSDVDPKDLFFRDIDLLRRTRIAPQGDYVFSGHGNHSTGVQQSYFQHGAFEFQPYRPATRLEVVKIALVSNCIPILDYIPQGTPTFTDVDKKLTGGDLHDFTSRVFYTAALHGIIKGYPDGSARPHANVDHLEVLAILQRSAGAVPEGYEPKDVSRPELQSDGWYRTYVSFAQEYHFLPSESLTHPVPRSTLSALLVKTMQLSEDIRVRAYMTSVGALMH
ncbi:hypothetical protein A2635_00895 [Candidatus Peribacteria bacterium RIFCSPHIGHO2_01_FULL_51_9]|nr:MAG: hypothetical protein A2635_00895 [Candidatus Peribacteria bacterium RIFCSPHIGHO2_01_FULL_51_9]